MLYRGRVGNLGRDIPGGGRKRREIEKEAKRRIRIWERVEVGGRGEEGGCQKIWQSQDNKTRFLVPCPTRTGPPKRGDSEIVKYGS